MLNVMPMKNGETIKIVDKTNGLTTIDVKETGFKERKSKEDVQIINAMRIVSG